MDKTKQVETYRSHLAALKYIADSIYYKQVTPIGVKYKMHWKHIKYRTTLELNKKYDLFMTQTFIDLF